MISRLLAATTLAAEESHVPEGIGLFIPPLGEVIISAIALGLIALVIVKVAVPAYLRILDERAEKIEGGLKQAAEAEEAVALEKTKWASQLEAVRAEVGKARDEAKQDAEAIIAEARREAAEENRRLLEAGQRQLEAERKSVEVALRDQLGDLATQLAEQIVGEALKDEALSRRVVDRFIADLDSVPANGTQTRS